MRRIDRTVATRDNRLPNHVSVSVIDAGGAPIATQTWKAGVYVSAVAVKRGPERGQTITTELMD